VERVKGPRHKTKQLTKDQSLQRKWLFKPRNSKSTPREQEEEDQINEEEQCGATKEQKKKAEWRNHMGQMVRDDDQIKKGISRGGPEQGHHSKG